MLQKQHLDVITLNMCNLKDEREQPVAQISDPAESGLGVHHPLLRLHPEHDSHSLPAPERFD